MNTVVNSPPIGTTNGQMFAQKVFGLILRERRAPKLAEIKPIVAEVFGKDEFLSLEDGQQMWDGLRTLCRPWHANAGELQLAAEEALSLVAWHYPNRLTCWAS